MRRIFALILLAVNAADGNSQTPIVLGNANMPGKDDTLRYTEVLINSLGNYMQTGTNFHWDFSNLSSGAEGLRSFQAAAQTPYFFFFGGPGEYGEKIADTLAAGGFYLTNYYNYYRQQSGPVNAFVADGVGLTFSSVPVPSYYTDKDELYVFPLTFGDRDSTTFRFSTPPTTLLPVRYTKAGYRITQVDGWGQVSTPYGTENCLRLVTTQYAQDTIRTTLFPLPPIGFPNYTRSYQWLTLTAKIPYMEVSGTLVGNVFTPTAARYRGYDNPFAGIKETIKAGYRLSPNPVSGFMTVSGEGIESVEFEIISANGVCAWRGYTDNLGRIAAGTLPAGLYVLRGVNGHLNQGQRFIKE